MRGFKSGNKFKKVTYQFIGGWLLQKQETEALEKVFKAFDVAGEGLVNKEEFRRGLKEILNLEISEEEMDKIFEEVDINDSGELEYSEFITACKTDKELLAENKLITAF